MKKPKIYSYQQLSFVKEIAHFSSHDIRIMKILPETPVDNSSQTTEFQDDNTFAIYSSKPSNISLFLKETENISLFSHPTLNPIRGISFNPNAKNSIVSVLYSGIPISSISSKLSLLSPTDKAIILYGVASALSYLHLHKIFFFNLDSMHIFLNSQNQPILDSYGLSCFLPQFANISFVAPELLQQLNSNGIDDIELCRVDIYSFGYFMIEIISGIRPTLLRTSSDRYFYSHPDNIPKGYNKIISQCTNFHPNERLTFEDILKQLEIASLEEIEVDNPTFSAYVSHVSNYRPVSSSNESFVYPLITSNEQDLTEQSNIPLINLPGIRIRKHNVTTSHDNESDPNNPYGIRLNTTRSIPQPPLSGTRRNLNNKTYPFISYREFQMQQMQQDLIPDISFIKDQSDIDELIRRDDPDSNYILGYYHEHKGEYSEAYSFYKKASSKEHAHALYRLGLLSMNGNGQQPNMKLASKMFLKAAKQRHSDAAYQFCLLHSDYKIDTPIISEPQTARPDCCYGRRSRNYRVKPQESTDDTKSDNNGDDDIRQCMNYLQYSADVGFPDSIFKLAILVEQGICFEQDRSRAFELYKKAANRGVTEAQYKAATMMLEGQGTPRAFTEAAFLYQKAARKGHTESIFKCGQLFEYGIGVTKNIDKALDFYRDAASKGHVQSKRSLAQIIANSQKTNNCQTFTNHIFTQKDIENAFQMMLEAASEGDIEAISNLGEMYRDGIGVEKNMKLAFECFSNVVKQNINHPFSNKNLNNVCINKRTALIGLNNDTQSHYARASVNLGLMYEQGLSTNPDAKMAVHYYQLSSDFRDPLGQFHLARAYENGIGLRKDLSQAAKFYRLSANQGFARSQFNIARYLEYGIGIPQDKSLAIQYYKCAARQGIKSAEVAVKRLFQNCL